MKNRSKIIAVAGAAAVIVFVWPKWNLTGNQAQAIKEIKPVYGTIQKIISATATVQPQNRLEMKPPIGGRVETILYNEGQKVTKGDIVALMSSTDRAALLDAARLQGADAVKYWEDVYKPTPLIAPIDGEVIVRTVQPGQTVTASDAVLVLSDRLIIKAQIDETDIGRVVEGQKAVITLDAYPDVEVSAVVGHIYRESKIVSNVTIYQADIVPETVPEVFRSGMSANVRIIELDKENILLVPQETVKHDKDGSFVMIKKGKKKKAVRRAVELGIGDDANVEILSGVGPEDKLVEELITYTPSKGPKAGTNPFMPGARKKTNTARRPPGA